MFSNPNPFLSFSEEKKNITATYEILELVKKGKNNIDFISKCPSRIRFLLFLALSWLPS